MARLTPSSVAHPAKGSVLQVREITTIQGITFIRSLLGGRLVLQPSVIVLENVRLMTSMKSSEGEHMIEQIVQSLSDIGYQTEFACLTLSFTEVRNGAKGFFSLAVQQSSGSKIRFYRPPMAAVTQECFLESAKFSLLVTFRAATEDLEQLESGESSSIDPLHFAVKHPVPCCAKCLLAFRRGKKKCSMKKSDLLFSCLAPDITRPTKGYYGINQAPPSARISA